MAKRFKKVVENHFSEAWDMVAVMIVICFIFFVFIAILLGKILSFLFMPTSFLEFIGFFSFFVFVSFITACIIVYFGEREVYWEEIK